MPTEPELRMVLAYLAVLRAELADAPDSERPLAEAEAHLREATTRGLAEGLSLEAAQRAAIARFGRVQAVADAARGTLREPVLHDARDGLPQAGLDELVRASRLALLLKDGRAAVLGYWIDERFAGALLVRRRDARGDLATTSGVPARALSVENNPVWRNLILPALHPGMRIHAEVWAGVPRLWFGPVDRGSSLGSSPAQQISLAFRARGEGRQRHLEARLG